MKTLMLWLSLAACVAAGAEVRIDEPPKLKPGRLGRITAKSDDAKPIRWINTSEDLDLIESETGRYAIVASGKPGRYKVAAYSDAGGPPAYVVIVVEGDVPPVPPTPVPPPSPPDPPKPAPAAGPLWIVVVEETADAAKDRGSYFASSFVTKAIKGHTLRRTDKDAVDKDGSAPADLKPYIERAKGKDLPQMYVVDKTGSVFYEAKLPGSPVEFGRIVSAIAKGEKP